MKNLYKFFTFFILMLCFSNVNASIIGKVSANELYVRDAATSNSSKVIGSLHLGATVTLSDKVLITGAGCAEGWYKIKYNGNDAYVCSKWITNIEENNIQTNNLYYTTSSYGNRVNSTYVNIRTGPSTSYSSIEMIYLGTPVKIIEKASSTSGCSKGWIKISYYESKEGFVCSNYISNYEDLTQTDEEYAKVLKELGFPNSYIPFLTKIHKDHPTWNFTPSLVNGTFDEAVSAEELKNGLQLNNSNYTFSDTRYEGTWYRTNNAINAFYLDPRNYLTDQNIFVFETQSYDKNLHTSNVIKTIFKGSYLESDAYVDYFMKAAEKYNISPVLLAIRARQEGKTIENDAGVTGKYTGTYNSKSLLGLYNFYNIEAYADSITTEPIERGLAFAGNFALGTQNIFGIWNSPENAIVGGAGWIAKAYVNRKQDTLYYQKFDMSPESSTSLGGNQYMTNILAHESEAISAYTTYKDNNLLETGFAFKIPVYKEMPVSFTSHPILGSNDNNLTSIIINNKNVDSFSLDELEYNFYIDNETTNLLVNATKSDENAQIKYNNGPYEIPLDQKNKTISITVTAQNGTTKTYIINIIRGESGKSIEDILSTLSVKTNDIYMSNIAFGTLSSTLISSINKNDANATVKMKDSFEKEITSSTIIKTGQTVTITSSNNETKTFRIVVRGDNNGDGNVDIVDLVKIQKHLLNSSILENEYFYGSDIDTNGKVDIVDLVKVQKYLLGASTL